MPPQAVFEVDLLPGKELVVTELVTGKRTPLTLQSPAVLLMS